jgi:hypothetical protein
MSGLATTGAGFSRWLIQGYRVGLSGFGLLRQIDQFHFDSIA